MNDNRSVHNIDEAIQSLRDESKPFPPALLYSFSDLDPEELHELRLAWPKLPLVRRRALLEDLIEMTEKDDLLMFEEVGKIALEDEDTEVLVSAIDLLFQAEDSRLIPVFLRLLQDAHLHETVRAAAANALGPYVYLGELDKIRPEILHTIEAALLRAYREDISDLVQRRALESLGYSSNAEVPDLLRAACRRADTTWLESALFAMGKSADDQWQNLVLAHLEHEDPKVRLQAIHASGELALQKARLMLLQILNQEYRNEELRNEAVWALSQIGGEGVEAAFYRLMERMEDEEDIEMIEEALDELNFTNDKGLFDLMEIELDEDLIQGEENEGQDLSGDELHEEESEGRPKEGAHFLSQGYDPDEWQRYVDEDDLDDDLEDDSEDFDDDEDGDTSEDEDF